MPNPMLVLQRQVAATRGRRCFGGESFGHASFAVAGHAAIGVFLVIGHAACHITGPSVVISVVLGAIASVISGKAFNYWKLLLL